MSDNQFFLSEVSYFREDGNFCALFEHRFFALGVRVEEGRKTPLMDARGLVSDRESEEEKKRTDPVFFVSASRNSLQQLLASLQPHNDSGNKTNVVLARFAFR